MNVQTYTCSFGHVSQHLGLHIDLYFNPQDPMTRRKGPVHVPAHLSRVKEVNFVDQRVDQRHPRFT
ncbi:hypothetical protein TSMEX_005898 [Taenia solium]|eukprot:TsM_000346400 transcript=TsM_000346400 gene=TsM_000346400